MNTHEPNYNWKNWRLIISEEFEKCQCDDEFGMNGNYPSNSFVYLWNNTIQIVYPVMRGAMYCGRSLYEIDLDRSDELDWLDHVADKVFSTPDMIRGLASAARRIGKIRDVKNKKYWDCWSERRADKAARKCSAEEDHDRDLVLNLSAAEYRELVRNYKSIMKNLMCNISIAYNTKDLEMVKHGYVTAQDELDEIGDKYTGNPSIQY